MPMKPGESEGGAQYEVAGFWDRGLGQGVRYEDQKEIDMESLAVP